MFGDKIFNMAILFSAAWHLFWISAVGISETPDIQPSSNTCQEVGFLGPILEKTAFDLMTDEATPQAEIRYAKSTLFLDSEWLKPKGPERKILKEFIPAAIFDRFSFSLRDYIKETKEIPFYYEEDIRMICVKTIDKTEFRFMEVEGTAANREVIFKPPPLTVSRLLYDNAEEYVVKLKFFVSNNGIVHNVVPLVSSGYPEIDLEATKFLKRWRFAPLSVAQKDSHDWGATSLRIGVK